MRFTNNFIPTLKEEPSESEIISHSLSIRSGLIRKAASGIYSFLPFGFKILKKIENIIREEMDRTGALEVLMPVIQPGELWQKTNRWYEYGPEMFKIADRNKRDFCLGPTHEELFTTIAGAELNSYKDLPINLYQIQVKFRDEIRPRYGLLRAREFIMKDAYSFGADQEQLEEDYNSMYKAYCRIIERIGLRYKIVEADTGLIGGSSSHEFMVLAENGEETIVYCDECGYAANADNAEYEINASEDAGAQSEKELKEVHTPDIKTIEELADFLKIKNSGIIKTILLKDEDSNFYAVVLSGDRFLNINKVEKMLGKNLVFINEENNTLNLPVGFVGPVNMDKKVKIIADYSVLARKNMVAGANRQNYHIVNVDTDRDFQADQRGSFSFPVKGDLCPKCKNMLSFEKGIEVGHIFKLGTKYSEKLNSRFLDINGNLQPFVMGCYGIGVTRLVAATIEQCHDDKGIIWPESIAPFKTVVIVTNMTDEKLKNAGEEIYNNLISEKIETLFDDREISAGIKFKDADLLGIPFKIIVGRKYLQNGKIEIESRATSFKTETVPAEIQTYLKKN
ncbi:MAG TPA: proline--tRNA ligase [Actinobacteria bacterium]|nr:proline--tRNA ligase [Actinomycetota bacterium]